MSNGNCVIRFEDGELLYGWYQGSSCSIGWFFTPEYFGCRYPVLWSPDDCPHEMEPVTIATDYGDAHWSGTACWECGQVGQGWSLYGMWNDYTGAVEDPEPAWHRKGLPDWWPWKDALARRT